MGEQIAMPDWGAVLKDLNNSVHPLDTARWKYLDLFSQYTNRNVISYYSGFLQKSGNAATGIDDNDKNAFMQAVHHLDKSKGLDLILHTPGGDIAATESIVRYLKSFFGNDIRAFIPQIAMSAGTMISMSCKEIVMGKQSSLGPIDPQYGGVSCHGVLEEFKQALEDVRTDQSAILVWRPIIEKYHPTFLGDCENAIDWAEKMVGEWLSENMFSGSEDKATSVVKKLCNHKDTKAHNRHFDKEECKKIGLKIIDLEGLDSSQKEDCQDLQDCLLTIHHTYMHTFSSTPAVKIVENHLGNGNTMIING